MRVLFVYPRWERFLEARPELSTLPYAQRLDRFRVMPLNIPAVAALTPPGVEIDVLDDFTDTMDSSRRPDLAAITAFTPQAARAYDLAFRFKEQGVPVVLGGIHPTVLPDEAMGHADAVVLGEAEGVWGQVLTDARNKALKPFYSGTPPADLAGLPAPRRDLFRGKGLNSVSVVQTGRGCPRRCPTCVLPAVVGHERRRPVHEVVEEIRSLEEPTFYLSEETPLFRDPANRAWTEEFLDALQGCNKTFFLATYPFLLDGIEPDLLRRLERAGNRQFYVVFGVDDAGPDALWQRVDTVRRALDAVREAGISVMGSFALGGEEDGPDCFERVFALARELEINLAEFFLLTPYPGTPFFRTLEEEGRILTRDWNLYNGAHPVFRPRRLEPDRLVEGFIELWRAFYGGMNEYSSSLRFVRGFGPDMIRSRTDDRKK